jgi:hypothetical protein
MDLLAKLIRHPAGGRARAREGAALATALFALSAAALLTAGVHWMTRVDIRTTTNRESAVRALTIAEAGIAHALGIMRDTLGEISYTQFLRGPDGVAGNADDSLLIGRTLSSGANGNDIPAAGRAFGGGSYTVRVMDDPTETDLDPMTDRNSRVLLRCIGRGPDGARVDLDVLIEGITMPGFVFDGGIQIPGNPIINGRCGGIHANDSIHVGGNAVVDGPVTSVRNTIVGGSLENSGGSTVTPMTNQPVAPMPDIDINRLCQGAQYIFEADGRVWQRTGPTDSVQVGSGLATAFMGFKRSSGPPKVFWTWEGTGLTDGAFCFKGNVQIGSPAGTSLDPMRWSIYATGSVSISSDPVIQSFDGDSILVAAGGDLEISGNPVTGEISSYSGALYSRHQCEISGNPEINGQLLCDNEPGQDVTRTEDYATQNIISGTPKLTYGCNNKWANTRRHVGWMQRQGP